MTTLAYTFHRKGRICHEDLNNNHLSIETIANM